MANVPQLVNDETGSLESRIPHFILISSNIFLVVFLYETVSFQGAEEGLCTVSIFLEF